MTGWYVPRLTSEVASCMFVDYDPRTNGIGTYPGIYAGASGSE